MKPYPTCYFATIMRKKKYVKSSLEIAAELGVTWGSVCNWRRNRRLPVNPVIRKKYLEIEQTVAKKQKV